MEDQPLAHGLFLAQNFGLNWLLLLFYVPPDKSQKQACQVVSNFPDIPVAPLNYMMYELIVL